jgi:hypothetical protein
MSACGECTKQVNRSEKIKVVCKVCRIFYHGPCAKLNVNEIEYISANNQWTCEACTKKRRLSRSFSDSCPVVSRDSLPTTNMGATLAELEPLLEKIKQDILDGQNKLEKEFNKSIELCFTMIKENSELVARQRERVDAQQSTIESLQGENKCLQSTISVLSKRLSELEQYSRKNTLEIFGVPEKPNENSSSLKKTVIDIGSALGVPLEEEAIDACHRIPAGNRPGTGIIVKFVRREDPDRLLARRKVKRDFSTRHVTGHTDDNPIYINLSLSKERRQLFAKARKLKTQFNYKYVWTDRNGRVRVRRDDDRNSKVCIIEDESDLDYIVKRETSGK